MKFAELKKGQEIRSKQLGVEVSGTLAESPKKGRGVKKTVLIFTKGSEVGMHDEHGSVYAQDITQAKTENDIWEVVEHGTPRVEHATSSPTQSKAEAEFFGEN
jgi:hypothetical protein